MNKKKDYRYVTLLTNDDYFRGVIIVHESLRRVGSEYPLMCVITNDVSQGVENILKTNGIHVMRVDPIPLPKALQEHNVKVDPYRADVWKNTLTKLNIFDIKCDKLIFLDADLVIMKNLDHCFEFPHMTAAVDGEYANLWADGHFNSGFMVIEPGKTSKEDLLKFASSVKPEDFAVSSGCLADQDILNAYFNQWPNTPELHLSKYYNIFPIHVVRSHEKDIMENAYFFHFVGTKPWFGKDVHEAIINKRTTVSILVDSLDDMSFCPEPYEFAYAFLPLSASAEYKPLNWEAIEGAGLFDYYVAAVATEFFKDFDLAERYLAKALEKSPRDRTYEQLAPKINAWKKTKKYCKTLADLLCDSLEAKFAEDKAVLKYYFILVGMRCWYSESAHLACQKLLDSMISWHSEEFLKGLLAND